MSWKRRVSKSERHYTDPWGLAFSSGEYQFLFYRLRPMSPRPAKPAFGSIGVIVSDSLEQDD